MSWWKITTKPWSAPHAGLSACHRWRRSADCVSGCCRSSEPAGNLSILLAVYFLDEFPAVLRNHITSLKTETRMECDIEQNALRRDEETRSLPYRIGAKSQSSSPQTGYTAKQTSSRSSSRRDFADAQNDMLNIQIRR